MESEALMVEEKPAYLFKKGHAKLGGRTKSGKNLLPIIRERVLKALNTRLAIDKQLKDVPTDKLLQFAQSIMPKDLSIRVSPDVQYISNTPRPALETSAVPQLEDASTEATVQNNDANTVAQAEVVREIVSDVVENEEGEG